MQKWIGAYLLPAHNDGKSLMIRGESADDMNACAMLTRSLVIRGNDAVMVTLPELLTMPDIRPSEYLVISGFFSSSYHNTHGRPMSAEKAYAYSWALWRIAEQGTTLVVFVDRGKTGEGAWWHEGLLSVFDRSISLNLSTTKTTV
jgi:hypothetical protein